MVEEVLLPRAVQTRGEASLEEPACRADPRMCRDDRDQVEMVRHGQDEQGRPSPLPFLVKRLVDDVSPRVIRGELVHSAWLSAEGQKDGIPFVDPSGTIMWQKFSDPEIHPPMLIGQGGDAIPRMS